jgi:hypothetical protein
MRCGLDRVMSCRGAWCRVFAWVLLACTGVVRAALPAGDPARDIVVAVVDRPPPALGVGATPHGYAGAPNYDGSQAARTQAQRIAVDYGLKQLSAWTIRSLRLRCMLYRPGDDADRDALLARLRTDDRVRLAEPLQQFSTLSAPGVTAAASPAGGYNDPYFGLQHGFSSIDAAAAQRWSQGNGVRIALIDTGVDTRHKELHGRIDVVRDFVGDHAGAEAAERHGTEVAGVIAADANNRIGIVGIAPAARIDVYRACWPVAPRASQSRCNSYTLAQALGAALDADARIINLSLGGPADPLLESLLRQAIARGAIVAAAVPPDGDMRGFPVDTPGVLAVVSTGQSAPASTVLTAPGRDILTLEPGQLFDYASGSSFATAHVSGVAALLLSLRPRLDTATVRRLLTESSGGRAGAPVNACAAVALLLDKPGACTSLAHEP